METEIKPIDWPNVFMRYEQSGLNQRAFCEGEGIPFFSFKNHRSKHLKQKSKDSGFAAIRVKSDVHYDLELTLPQGFRLKLNSGVPVDYVKRLLSALR